jgi:two-component system OmpR family sensor kinase
MLVEKKSFKRFLVIYISSTMFLLSVGVYLYYKVNYQFIINSNISSMKSTIEKFIKLNHNNHLLKSGVKPDFNKIPIAIFVEGIYRTGNFKPIGIDLEKEYTIVKDSLYYINTEQKKWGELYFVTYKNIKEEVDSLRSRIVVFFLFSIVFIIFISYILGKIFLKPMRDTIKSLENFISDATHEINTPISNIIINIELIRELYPDFKSNEEFSKVENSVFRISKIFKDLSFIKLHHKQKKEILNVDVKDILEDRLEFFKALIENKKLQLSINIESKELLIDKEDLIRVIDNLLSNAIKYTKMGSNIDINLTNEYFEVINSGNIKNSENIKNKFVRENRDEGGFGLGLYIVEKICNTYGLKFSIESLDNKVITKVLFI